MANDLSVPEPRTAQKTGRWSKGFEWGTIFWIGLLHVGALAAPFFFTWQGLVLLVVLSLATQIGVCLGYHRMLTHGSFETYRPLRWLFGTLGALAGEGPPLTWVAMHRKHHRGHVRRHRAIHSIPRYSYRSYPRPIRHGRPPYRESGRWEKGPRAESVNTLARTHGSTETTGWRYMSEGRYQEARRSFARDASRHPRQGMPKVGFALVSAATGDLSQGSWAMRRALRLDAGALHYVVLDGSLRTLIDDLIREFEAVTQRNKSDQDAAFMLGALYYLVRDEDRAFAAIQLAHAAGDESKSLAELEHLVETHVAEKTANRR